MTQQELSLETYRFSTVINTSEKNFPSTDKPSDVDLAACFYAFLQREYLLPPPEEPEPIKTPEDHRHQALETVLLKLSSLDTAGKEHIAAYLHHQYRRNFQASTIKGSYTALSCFVSFLKERGTGGIEEMTKPDLEAFIEHLQDKGITISTVKLRLARLKAFLRFIIDRGALSEAVFPWNLTIKMPEPLPRAMDPEDVDTLLAARASVRDRAMVLLLLRTGMRIGELLSTRVSDVTMEEQRILIYEGEKNQRGRVVYFSDDSKAALTAWIKERRPCSEVLFYGLKGRPLSYQAARMMFDKYLDTAGLSHKGYTLHCLRHTYATDLINARMPLECLEKLMGHSRLAVTRRYALLTDKTREEEYFKAMAIIERREQDGNDECDRELPAISEKTELFPAHPHELHEHPETLCALGECAD
jgi:integrase/recombinase XerD